MDRNEDWNKDRNEEGNKDQKIPEVGSEQLEQVAKADQNYDPNYELNRWNVHRNGNGKPSNIYLGMG